MEAARMLLLAAIAPHNISARQIMHVHQMVVYRSFRLNYSP